jgi:hypothetical protein
MVVGWVGESTRMMQVRLVKHTIIMWAVLESAPGTIEALALTTVYCCRQASRRRRWLPLWPISLVLAQWLTSAVASCTSD